jgi:hypothetical protein
VVTQGPLNSQLGRSVGGLQASVVALGISFLAILAASVLTGGSAACATSATRPLADHVTKVSGVVLPAVGTWLVIRD